MDVEGLAKEWDATEEVRERLRAGKKMYDHPLSKVGWTYLNLTVPIV